MRLLAKHHFPHYVRYETRPNVLSLYRQVLREAKRMVDPLCRRYIAEYAHESLLAFKYVTSPTKINALLVEGAKDLATLGEWTRGTGNRGCEAGMRWVFGRYLVKELPLSSLVGHRLPKTLPQRVNNMQMPSERTYAEYTSALKSGSHLYYRYYRALQRNKIVTGQNGRKLKFDVREEGTMLGNETPMGIQKNAVRKTMHTAMCDMPTPWHPKTIKYVQNQIRKPEDLCTKFVSSRYYRRRLDALLASSFTVDMDPKNHNNMVLVWPNRPGSQVSPGNSYHNI